MATVPIDQGERQMNDNDRGVRLHDALVHMGWIAGPQAHSLAYWTMRLADEIEGVGRYAVAHREMRELAWDNVRPFDTRENAVSASYPRLVEAFMRRHEHRMTGRYRQTLDEIRTALALVARLPAETGRVPLELAA
jgi:hypothetical protein